MSVRSDVLMWAQRVVGRGTDTPAHVVLDIAADASVEEAQAAFHKIARTSHPDLHRASLTPEDLEVVTTAYARVAGAYQEIRSKRLATQRMRPLKDEPPPPKKTPSDKITALRPQGKTPEGTPPIQRSATLPGVGPASSGPMNSKALIYYRKVEMCLRQGDLKTAVLNMKMAIAGDPQSTFLRDALSEIEAELSKK